jgi:DNA-binding MarR family transcriptional regulator
MTALMNVEQADFMFIVNVTGMTKGNISSHLDKLEKGGLVNIEKSYTGKIPVTYLSLTSEGRKEIVAYWETVGSLGKQITNEK